MKHLGLCAALLGVVNCMGVQVPEDYVSDLYYGKPKVLSVSAATSTSLSSVPVQIKFASPMNTSSVTVDAVDGPCTGSIQVSTLSANFGSCLGISSLSSETRDSVFTARLSTDIEPNSNYLVKVLSTTTDFLGNTLAADTILTFKSGVPAGFEPIVTSVGFGKKLPNNITVQFSPRPMDGNSITAALTKDCNTSDAVFILTDPNGNCVNGGINTTPGNLTTYALNFNLTVVGSYVMVVRPGLTDQLGISTIAAFTSPTVPLTN